MPFLHPLLPFVVLTTMAASSPSDDAIQVRADTLLPVALQAILDRAVGEGRATGASALVARADELLFRGSAGHLGPDDPVEIASSTKPIVAALVAALADDGILDLDTPVSAWLPEWSEAHLRPLAGGRLPGRSVRPRAAASRAPKLRELLTHTSGIPPLYPGGRPTTGSLADFSERTAGRGLVTPPGARFAYGGPSYDIAARVAEVAGGLPFEELLETRLLGPLGMGSTRFGDAGRLPPARMELADGEAPGPRSNRWVSAGGGLTSTLDDLLRFWRLHLTDGVHDGARVMSGEALRGIRTPMARNPNRTPFGADYGLGVYLDRSVPGGPLAWASHGGAFGTLPWVDMEREIVVVVFVPGTLARANPVIREIRAAIEAYLPGAAPPGEETPLPGG